MAARGIAPIVALLADVARSLDNGLARTPPMGFNNYMSGVSGEEGLGSIADFILSSGMREAGYVYVNTDEDWETKGRNNTTGRLQWSSAAYPSGLPTFISRKLHARGLKFGIYGAASGVTCHEKPGQLYHEDLDAATYAEWGVDFLKSDTCASYALDSSVRFGAMRDALNRTGRPIVFSVEPFSIRPDLEQGPRVANLWRVACDIESDYESILDRADISDKWSPLAGPGGWNDPDMIHLCSDALSPGENRLYFALWCIMKAPLLLSSNLPRLDPSLIALASNKGLIEVNQDPLGVQARKLVVDGQLLPWLVSLAPCDAAPPTFYSRNTGMASPRSGRGADTRLWSVTPTASAGAFRLRNRSVHSLKNLATGRCLALAPGWNSSKLPLNQGAIVLLPCQEGDATQQWHFDKGVHTVTSVTNVAAGLALAVPNSTLAASQHGMDAFQVADAAYGKSPLVLVEPFVQAECNTRDCQDYDPSQMWYFSPTEGLLRHATYTASINHKSEGAGYTLTQKVPTWQHHCLGHALSVANKGTASGSTEVWGGPLSGGAFVLALLNRGPAAATIHADFGALALGGADVAREGAQFNVRDVIHGVELGLRIGGIARRVPSHDIAVFRLSVPQTSLIA